jgi:hypothetical protein
MIYPQFRQLLQDHERFTGFHLPLSLETYIVEMLSDRLEKTEIIPHPSFAERYLELYHRPSIQDLKDFADSSLFFCSLMPEYGNRRGLNLDYYASLGISVYYTAGDLTEDARYTQLGNWFYHLQKFLNSCLHGKPLKELVIQ